MLKKGFIFIIIIIIVLQSKISLGKQGNHSGSFGMGYIAGTKIGSGTNGLADYLTMGIEYEMHIRDFEIKEKISVDKSNLFAGEGRADIKITGFTYDFTSGPRHGVTIYQKEHIEPKQFQCKIRIGGENSLIVVELIDNPTVNYHWSCVAPGYQSWTDTYHTSLSKVIFGANSFTCQIISGDFNKYIIFSGKGNAQEKHFCDMNFTTSMNGHICIKHWDNLNKDDRRNQLEDFGYGDLDDVNIDDLSEMNYEELKDYFQKLGLVWSGFDRELLDKDKDDIEEYTEEEEKKLELEKSIH